MALLDNMYVHNVVYWAPLGASAVDHNGQVTFASPVQICGRWNEITEMFLDRNGNHQMSRVKVRLRQDVEELGVLWKGCLADLTSESDPFAQDGAWEIRKFSKIGNRHATKYLRIAWL